MPQNCALLESALPRANTSTLKQVRISIPDFLEDYAMTTKPAYAITPYPAWDATHAANLDDLGQLVYRSQLLGSDQRITNTGGGNTSAKCTEIDPVSGEMAEVLWVKGSGGDLRTAGRSGFASLYQSRLLTLQDIYAKRGKTGVKTASEDAMVAMYPHCTFNLNARAASIDTPLHSFVPHRHVDHMHPNAVISIAAARNSRQLTEKIYGGRVGWLPWQRPGFDLGLQLQTFCRDQPQAIGAIMGGHGIINWADDAAACHGRTIELIRLADDAIAAADRGQRTFGGPRVASLDAAARRQAVVAMLPWLRGQVSVDRRQIATVVDDEPTRRFVNSHDAARLAALGTSCPDHFLRTKIRPLYVPWDPLSGEGALRTLLEKGLAQYRDDYAAYYERCKRADSPAMRDANPTVVLIPGIGLIAFGKTKSESRTTAEFYGCAIEVMRGAEALDEYVALDEQEAFDIEYWALEEAKLRRMPPEAELARQVVVVIGAGSGIGKEVAHRLAVDGAHIACADVRAATAEATAAEVVQRLGGPGIGVAGSGLSGCGQALGIAVDITNRAAVRAALEEVIWAYGGLDQVVVTAGIFCAADTAGNIRDDQWALTFAINVTGQAFVAEEAAAIFTAQGLPANVVLTTSVNAVVPKKGSLAYDTSKAAADHLVRELAVSLAPLVRVNAVAPATVVKGSSMFPRDRVIGSLAKYGIRYDDSESDDVLRDKLAGFYAQRTLLKQPITPADQAEAVFLLCSPRLARTTGQIINVDGGLHEAFLR